MTMSKEPISAIAEHLGRSVSWVSTARKRIREGSHKPGKRAK